LLQVLTKLAGIKKVGGAVAIQGAVSQDTTKQDVANQVKG
jgi:hypothetical protein